MADWTVKVTKQGWAGDVRRNTVIVSGTNDDILAPAACGLAHVHAVVPTGHNGVITHKGTDYTVVPAGAVSYSTTETATQAALALFTVGTSPAAFTDTAAELYVFGV